MHKLLGGSLDLPYLLWQPIQTEMFPLIKHKMNGENKVIEGILYGLEYHGKYWPYGLDEYGGETRYGGEME